MAKLSLTTIAAGYGSVDALNANFDAIEAAIENTLSRDGTTPNTMSANLDMNSKRILNLPAPVSSSEPARLQDVQDAVAGGSASLISFSPAGNIAATSVQGAIEELDSEKLAASGVSAFMATVLDDTTAAAARTTLGAASAADLSALDAEVSTLLLAPGIKQGLTLSNNATDATNDIDVAAGKAVDSSAAVVMSLASAMTKRLDANWAAGTGNGGRYSGAAIANTTYHVWLVAKAAGADVDVYLDPSTDAATVLGHLQAETGGADYLYVWRIGSIMRESGVIVPFVQNFSEFQRKTPLMDVAASSTGTSAVLRTFAIPTGLKLIVKYYAYMRNSTGSGGNYHCYFSDPDVVDLAPSITISPGVMGGDGPLLDSRQGMIFFTRTNTSAQIRSRAGDTSASATLYMSAHAWIDEGIYRS